MNVGRWRELAKVRVLLAGGCLAFLLTSLSIGDMFRPRPWDGVVLEADVPGRLIVREVGNRSGADRAGIRPGDRILGLDRELLLSPRQAAALLQSHPIGSTVPYLLERDWQRYEVLVQLGPRRIGSASYALACLLGFSFFAVGLFVILRQPGLHPARVFFALSTLFLLFLVCRLRPASYSGVDLLVLQAGTAALLLLPGTFLHFCLVFPSPTWRSWRPFANLSPEDVRAHALLVALYLAPVALYLWILLAAGRAHRSLRLLSGAPRSHWWLLALYVVAGLTALAIHAHRAERANERRGLMLVLFGSIFGLVPFLITAVAFPSHLHDQRLLVFGVGPLALVPATFAYAIVRFQLLDIRVILRKSLLYTTTTALITALYALGIASFNALFRDTRLATAPYFPLVFAMVIVLGFEPLRRRLQGPVDRFFFAERLQLQRALIEMGEELAARVDLGAAVTDLVERLPRQLDLHFAALYLLRRGRFERVAGPALLPRHLPDVPLVGEGEHRRPELLLLSGLADQTGVSAEQQQVLAMLAGCGVEIVGPLASPRRHLGLVLLSGKAGQLSFEAAELELLQGLLGQAALGLESSLLLEERTEQVKLERDLKIAAGIQTSLLPTRVRFAPGWQVAARCLPARQVGGDFYAELPTARSDTFALAYGDVSGKSVPGALMMMAAQEVLHSLAMTTPPPEELLRLANRRLYQLRRRSFVALGYLAADDDGCLMYSLAGQPHLLHRDSNGQVRELPLPSYRLPLGAMAHSHYDLLAAHVAPREVVLGCSDGVLDARSADEETFGSERLIAALEGAGEDAEHAVEAVLEALQRFSRGRELYDDVTLVALSRPALENR